MAALTGILHAVRKVLGLTRVWVVAEDMLAVDRTLALGGPRRHCRSSCVSVGYLNSFEAVVTYDEEEDALIHGQWSWADEGLRHPSPSSPHAGGMVGMGHALARRTGGCGVGSDLASEHRTPGHGGVGQTRDAALVRQGEWGSAAQTSEARQDEEGRADMSLDGDDGSELEAAAAGSWCCEVEAVIQDGVTMLTMRRDVVV